MNIVNSKPFTVSSNNGRFHKSSSWKLTGVYAVADDVVRLGWYFEWLSDRDSFLSLFCGKLVTMFESQGGTFGIMFFATQTVVYTIGISKAYAVFLNVHIVH